MTGLAPGGGPSRATPTAEGAAMRVALFITCVNDALNPRTGQAVVALLERLGVEVDFPAAQTCCGQPQYNTGYRHETEPLVRRLAAAFEGYDYVVTPSGSCAAMVRDNYPRIGAKAAAEGRGNELADAAGSLVPKTYELTEFLVDVLGVQDVGAYFPHTVTYHPTCHGLRMLQLGDRPLRLLRAVKGLELRELPEAEECCGFGGTFSVKNSAVSAAMGADKVRHALDTGAEVLCAGDNSCLMHVGGTLRRQDAPLSVLHLAEILACTEDDPDGERWGLPATTTRRKS
jgi:L-lactate dehydrogenase complex protein LldE